MPRKKKESVAINKSEKEPIKTEDHFTYCGNRRCLHRECLRHDVNTPWNVLIYRSDFTTDKDGNCKDIILERK